MKNKTEIDLVAAEVAGLWYTYITDTLVICMLKYFINKVKDDEIRPVLQHALDISNGHLPVIRDNYSKDGLPIPKGFTDEDVDVNAPPLFTDPFYLFYLLNVAQFGMNIYTYTLNHIARPDMRKFFKDCTTESMELFVEVVDVLQQQGLYIKSPRLEFVKKVDSIDNQNFFSSGWFGQKRSLLAREVTSIFASLRQNIIGEALVSAFGQVAKSKKVSDFFFRGRDLAFNKIKELNMFLLNENLPIPSTSDSFVKDSTIPPFSDKLMMDHAILLFSSSISLDGMAFSNVMRNDLRAFYAGSIAASSKYAEDGMDIVVENKWLEQPPQVIDNKNLVKD